ncbi:beta-galactosidase [Pseudomonas borbori]
MKLWTRSSVESGRKQVAAFLLSLALLICPSVEAGSSLSLKGPRDVVWADFLGVNAQLLWFEEASYRHQLEQMQALGLNWVRVDLHWDRLEPTPGQWQLSEMDRMTAVLAEKNIKSLLFMVGSAPFASSAPAGTPNYDQYPPTSAEVFADSMGYLAARYPSVDAWQVWNEQNISPFWQPAEDPVAYSHLLETTLDRLKTANPAAQRVMGGMAYYSQMPLRGGLMLEAMDSLNGIGPDRVVAYHPYSMSPEGDVVADKDFLIRGTVLNQRLRELGSEAIWATEFGWSSYTEQIEWQPLVGEQGQADYLIKRIALMSAMDYDRIFLFNLSDLDARATVRDRKYGLLRLDGSQKPAYQALKRFLDITGPSVKPMDAPAFANAPDGMLNMAWQRPDGRWVWVFWAQVPGQVTLPRPGQGTLYNPLRGTSQTVSAGAGGITVEVGTELQILLL